jgi:hypothetical protein
MDEDESIQTRIFSDCFSSYQPNVFKNLGYIVKRVNHSIWFDTGSLHTNTIESLWSQIKNIIQNFSGLVVDLIKKNLIIMRLKLLIISIDCYVLRYY